MVCAKCEASERSKKTTTLAVTDVWKAAGSGSDQRNERKLGSNKLLEARRRYTSSVPAAGSALRKGKGNLTATDVGSSKRGAGADVADGQKASSEGAGKSTFGKCKVCKVTVAKEGAKYCQRCAYKEGICVMCETKILDTSQYKMSAK
ncbi:hypothetical protein EMMF5_000839 [Cystobasidiomycetes sp. EMM_F5]